MPTITHLCFVGPRVAIHHGVQSERPAKFGPGQCPSPKRRIVVTALVSVILCFSAVYEEREVVDGIVRWDFTFEESKANFPDGITRVKFILRCKLFEDDASAYMPDEQ